MASAISSSGTSTSSDVFLAAGVASLDTPQLNQTKLEIRTLVSEVAHLASSDIELTEFLCGALPRICNAMGATAAALWDVSSDTAVTLAGHYKLPDMFAVTAESQVSPEVIDHDRILRCVAQDGAAVLVPPKSTKLGADRPTNPFDQSLLVVPIKIFDHCEALLEVIQPHSGGPAAQRGYLRFVAQMADLVAEHLRRRQLRKLTRDAAYVASLRQALAQVGEAETSIDRLKVITRSWANMLSADLALALTPRPTWIPGFHARTWNVSAISDVENFDARSDAVLAAERWLDSLSKSGDLDRMDWVIRAEANHATETLEHSQKPAVQLCHLLGCEQVVRVPVAHCANEVQILLAFSDSLDRSATQARAHELSQAFSPLITKTTIAQPRRSQTARSLWQASERWVVRLSTLLLLVSLALFPVPDSLGTVAVLEAVDKQFYFAPSAATIQRILVDSHQLVKQGDTLVELVDQQLQAKLEELEGQLLSLTMQQEQDRAAVLRGQQAGRTTEDEMNARIEQTRLNLHSISQQIDILRTQSDQLHIRAKNDGVVTTWDARNRLQGRPVAAGQLLLTSCAPNSAWQLKLSIPERQVGRIEQALAHARAGLNVQFSLSSHPGQVQTGRLIDLSKQLVKDQDGNSNVMGTVIIAPETLPTKTDGAVARASIDCGRTLALWLLVRDAYRQATTWWRLL